MSPDPGPSLLLLAAALVCDGCIRTQVRVPFNVFSQEEWDAFGSPEDARRVGRGGLFCRCWMSLLGLLLRKINFSFLLNDQKYVSV